MDAEAIVINIIVEEFNLRRDEIELQNNFYDDLGLDSLDVMCVIMKIEENFNITIPDEEIEEIDTIQDIIDYLHEQSN